MLAAACSLLVASGALHGQSDPGTDVRAAVQRWLDAAWDEAQQLEAIDGFSIRWRIEDRYVPPPSELSAMKADLEDKPDHRDRWKLDVYLRRSREGPDIQRYELWIRGWNAWRINMTMADGNWWDKTWAPRRAWSLTPRALVISDPRLGTSATEPIVTNRSAFMPQLTLLLHGGLGLARTMGLTERAPVEASDEDWSFTAETGGPVPPEERMRVRFSGRWDASLGRGFVEDVRVVQSPSNARSRWRIEGWALDEAIGRHVASRVHYTAPGFDRLIIYEGSQADPPGGFAALTALPEPGGSDVIRGEIDPPAVQDLRSGETRVRDAAGRITVTKNDGQPQLARRTPWRWIGIVLLAAVVITVVLAARRRRRRLAGAGAY